MAKTKKKTSGGAKTALIVTIGTELGANSGLLGALESSIRNEAPGFLVLVASPESEPDAKKLLALLEWPAEASRVEILESAHDLDGVFRTVNANIKRLISKGYDAERIAVNYTSGTKVMSSGAVLSAIYNLCQRLQYVTGSEGGKRPVKTLSTYPRAIGAYHDLTRARDHALATQFRSAKAALDGIDESLLTDYDRGLMDNLREVVEAYSAWEGDRARAFLAAYEKIEFGAEELAPFQLREDQREILRSLAADCEAMRSSARLAVAIRNSAWRQYREGHYDNAIHRLYRSLEILAQSALRERYGIDTDNLVARKVPPRDRPRFEALRSREDGLIRIGLRKAYELLEMLGEPVGIDFANDPALLASLKERHNSLLAHGACPVSRDQCEKFLTSGTSFLRRHIEGFDTLCQALQFPWVE